MSDFVQTMKDWRRMCAAFENCEECPQYREYQCYNTIKRVFESGDIESLEYNVLKWAEEHPEPVYPTWGEYLASIGVMKPAQPDKAYEIWFSQLYSTTIPADIAQKLGIEPKEGI